MSSPKTCIGKDISVLNFAMLKNMRKALREYAKHECEGCRIEHPSQNITCSVLEQEMIG